MAVVLLVSSDPELRDGWRDGLAGAGHDVVVATTAAAAADQLLTGGVDVIVVEYEVAGGLGALETELLRIPDPPALVMLSGAVDAPSGSARLGAAAFLPKPCGAAELTAAVARVAPTPVPMEEVPTAPIARG